MLQHLAMGTRYGSLLPPPIDRLPTRSCPSPGERRNRGLPHDLSTILFISFFASTLSLPAGCAAPNQSLELKFTRCLRTDPAPSYCDAISYWRRCREDERYRNDYVALSMCEMSAAILAGQYDYARDIGAKAYHAIRRYEDQDAETLAALSRESIKFFKGEPHERELLFFYTGLMFYIQGDYNNARIFFAQSLLATATRDDDMADFREDFTLGHYWLGRAYLKQGNRDNARVGFRKASVRRIYSRETQERDRWKRTRAAQREQERKGETLCYQTATTVKNHVSGVIDLSRPSRRQDHPIQLPGASPSSPLLHVCKSQDEFFTVECQERLNLILIIELGQGPIKYLAGSGGAIDEIMRAPFKEEYADVYIDGHFAGAALEFCDVYHQAITRGVQTRRGRQAGKAVTWEILRRAPYVGSLLAQWDIRGDHRHWPTLPGKIALFGAQVNPGLRDISLRFFDANDEYLPRFDMTRHFLGVPGAGESVFLIQSRENEENAYVLAATARSGG